MWAMPSGKQRSTDAVIQGRALVLDLTEPQSIERADLRDHLG